MNHSHSSILKRKISLVAVILMATAAMLPTLCTRAQAADPPDTTSQNEPVKDTMPDNTGPVKVVSASWLGGASDDEIVGTGVGLDGSIILAGNSADLPSFGTTWNILGPSRASSLAATTAIPGSKDGQHLNPYGYVIRLSPDGQNILSASRFGAGSASIRSMKLDEKGNIYLLGEASAPFAVSGDPPAGAKTPFLAQLSPNARSVRWMTWHTGPVNDFAVDSNGEFVVLSGTSLERWALGSITPKWTVHWSAHGSNRPGAMTLSPTTGVAAVVGYGMTGTGHEPYKDPYAYGFDRNGKQVWMLWNPDPKAEVGNQFGGNGLMADTTGHAAAVDVNGSIYLMLFADGGNTVLGKDPSDPSKPLAPEVMNGVFQANAGYGFHGASKTSAIFRVNPTTGAVEKATFMSAWIGWPQRDRANGLSIDAAAGTPVIRESGGGETGLIFLVGDSSYGYPTLQPWFESAPGFYKGGGFLAVMDRNFKMIQSGYFPGCSIRSVAYRNGTLVIAGTAGPDNEKKDKNPATGKETTTIDPIRLYHPLQHTFGGGGQDAYYVILKVEDKTVR